MLLLILYANRLLHRLKALNPCITCCIWLLRKGRPRQPECRVSYNAYFNVYWSSYGYSIECKNYTQEGVASWLLLLTMSVAKSVGAAKPIFRFPSLFRNIYSLPNVFPFRGSHAGGKATTAGIHPGYGKPEMPDKMKVAIFSCCMQLLLELLPKGNNSGMNTVSFHHKNTLKFTEGQLTQPHPALSPLHACYTAEISSECSPQMCIYFLWIPVRATSMFLYLSLPCSYKHWRQKAESVWGVYQ